jgi:cytoplasmic iron level regulating protein YaaA (DUF328/UPF0246 family)
MYILFSPSEGKKLGGNGSSLDLNTLLVPSLSETRLPLLSAYNVLMKGGSQQELQALTGIKKEEEIKKYQSDLFSLPTMNAIERYDGVAYDYLDFDSLSKEEKSYLNQQTIIFSNLFGPLRGGDSIPAYKLKQGATIKGTATEKVYKEASSDALDELFKDELILDLRAGYYEKFYTLNQPFITMKFLKGGKSVSHWAKAYRGKVLRTIASVQPKTQEELCSIDFEGLQFVESVNYKKNGLMLVYEVL